MGIVASGFAKAAHSAGWDGLGRGPRLRQIFGAYGSQDCWAVQRRFRQLDDGNGFIGYEELQKLVGAEEFALLFLWDLFSQQNELMDIKDLLSIVCFFSSMRFDEKGKFLLALFDESKCSVCTGAEVAQLCTTILGALARCTGSAAVRVRDVGIALKQDLPELLTAYKDSVHVHGADATFNKERVIHHSELAHLLAPIQHAYERLTVSQPPPPESPPPPSPEWGIIHGAPQGAGGKSKARSAYLMAEHGASTRAVATTGVNDAEPHLAWLRRLEDEESAAAAAAAAANTPAQGPLKSWLLLHCVDFAEIARDLQHFRQAFARSVTTSLGLASTCAEVANVALGPDGPTSTLVEFLLHPPISVRDERSVETLLLVFEQQLGSRHSALRKSEIGAYLADAEILAGEPQRCLAATSPKYAARGLPGLRPGTADAAEGADAGERGFSEQGTQSDAMELLAIAWPMKRPVAPASDMEQEQLRAAFRSLEAMRRRTQKAESAIIGAEEKLRWKDQQVEDLKRTVESLREAR